MASSDALPLPTFFAVCKSWDGIPGFSYGRLHAKVAVIDDSMVYIGSMNPDPRSESTNTELGIFIRCPELARDVNRAIDATRLQNSSAMARAPSEPVTSPESHFGAIPT